MIKTTQAKKKEINALLRLENKKIVLAMSDEEAGALMKAIFIYGTEGVIPETLNHYLQLIFLIFKEDIDNDRKSYEEMCERNAANASRSHKKRAQAIGSDRNQPETYNNKYNNNYGENISPPLNEDANEKDDPQYPFDKIWELYDKPVGNKDVTRDIWLRLSHEDKKAIYEYVPFYIRDRPQKRFRKNFDRFLTFRTWENEPISNTNTNKVDNDTEYFTNSKPDKHKSEIYKSAVAAMQQVSVSQ